MKALKYGVCGTLTVLLLAAIGVGLVGWHQGWRVYAVQTGSMTPTYPTGALVVDRPMDGGSATVGDVITFPTRQGLVTHRVHAITHEGIETKGDANETPDSWAVPPGNVMGEVAWGSAYLGYAFVFFQQPTGAPSILLLGLSIWFAWLLFFPAKGTSDAAAAVPVEPVLVDDRPALIVLPGVEAVLGVEEPATTVLAGERSRARSHLRSA